MIKNVQVIAYSGAEFDGEVYQTVDVRCELDGITNFYVTFGSSALGSALEDAMDGNNGEDFDAALAKIIDNEMYGYVRTDILATMDEERIAKFIEDNFN